MALCSVYSAFSAAFLCLALYIRAADALSSLSNHHPKIESYALLIIFGRLCEFNRYQKYKHFKYKHLQYCESGDYLLL